MNSKALGSTTGPTVRRDYIFEIRRILLIVLPVLLLLSSNGTASPTLGAHVLAFYTCSDTKGNLVAPAIATQSSGSTILVWAGVGHTNTFSGANPLDSYGNSYGMVGTINSYAPDYPSSGAALFAVPLAAGGSGEVVTKPMPFNDEVTLAVVEVRNGGVIQDAEFNRVPGPPQTSLNVTTTGPATLVAIWAGYSGGASVTAVPDNSFTTIDSQLLSYCEVEAVVATKDVASAGTYNVTWTATPTQEALLWLIAVQSVASSSPLVIWSNPAPIGYGAPLGTNQLNAAANVPGSFVYSPPAGTVLQAGSAQALSAIFTPVDTTNYNSVTKAVRVDILKSPLTVRANNNSKVYGAVLPTLAASYSGFVNGDTAASLGAGATLSTAANASSPVGLYTITASGAISTNYALAYVNGTLAVTQSLATGVIVSSANPSPPGTNVTFTMTLSPVAPGAGTPSGTVNFRVDGSVAASRALSGGVATFTTNNLALGPHTVAAEYAGDLNFVGATNALAQNQVINSPPVAGNLTIGRYPAQGAKVLLATLLASDSDPDGDALNLVLSSISANGAAISQQGGWVFYTPPAGFTNADSFTYTVTDGRGGSATGLVSIVIEVDFNPSQTIVAMVDLGNNSSDIKFLGIPGRVYTIQYATNLIVPNWQSLGVGTADATGSFDFVYTPAAGVAGGIYRSIYP
jgi:hypothetical protein